MNIDRYDRLVFWFALASIAGLLFNIAAIPIHKELVLSVHGHLSNTEILMIFGFFLVFVFNLVSILWLTSESNRTRDRGARRIFGILFGVLCLVLLYGDKVMIDEIARAWRAGAGIAGGLSLMYLFLLIQLAYNIFILLHMRRCRLLEVPPAAVS
ncbi:MAG: hypothetical protein KJ970_12535 [Candidatus Eisenbacteria bacterium]|uniref:Uncharacterized protein n=1 Tax=Eiseniibacteriota bacterium TaxID=2212470 RepID=A0A948RVF2_UNCEI|nr:hypothetical protein [Candidatus Eisenbacteria bacterium]MBU1950633.1 hypothetical protein [Candidatus Eisenbacteria bacterium]MBU2691745.1 hypothetical protein [Candidatus Eisenbacteria bacterium]